MINSVLVLKNLLPKIIQSTINIGFSKLLTLASTFYLARQMGSEQFGKYAYIYATVVLFQMLAAFSMGGTAAKHIAIHTHDNKLVSQLIGFVLTISAIGGFIGAGLFFALVELGVLNLGGVDIRLIILSSVAIFLGATSSAIKGIIVGMERLRLFSYISIATAVMYIPILYWLTLNYKFSGAIASISLFFLCDFFFSLLALNFLLKKLSININFSLRKIKMSILFDFSFPSALSGVVILISTWLGIFLVGKADGGFQQVGIFAIASQWRSFLLLLPAIVENVTIPILSRIAVRDKEELKTNISANFFFIVLTGGILLIVLLFFKNDILSYYGEDYLKSADVFSLMILSGFLFAINAVVGQFIVSAGSMWHGLFLNMLWGFVFLIGIFFFVSDAYTLAICYFLSYVIHGVIQAIYFIRFKSVYGFGV